MTMDEYIAKLRKQRDEIDAGKPLFLATSTVVSDMSERIFTQGKNIAGDTFAYNSTDEIYVDPVTSPGKKFPPKGKTGKTTFATGKKAGQEHKTGWFASYKSYRDTIGRPTAKVVFNLSGELKSDFENGLKRITNNEYELVLKRDIDAKKRSGLDERYNTVFEVSQKEKDDFNRYYTEEVIKILNR